MIYTHKRLLLTLITIQTSCGPGFSDYSENIGNSNLKYYDTGPINKLIVKPGRGGEGSETLVKARVLSYRIEQGHIFGLRQMVVSYFCEPAMVRAEIKSDIDFFVLSPQDNDNNYSASHFHDFLEFKQNLQTKNIRIEYIDTMAPNLFKEKLLPATPLGECSNPKLIE